MGRCRAVRYHVASPQGPADLPSFRRLEAGLIYYIIFAFHIAIILLFSRMPLQQSMQKQGVRISWLHTCLLRLGPVIVGYFFLSLACVSFQAD